MGVNGLWTVVQPCARPTNLATLNRKRLAVDASIWIYQFLKAVRDKEGNALRNSHVVGFFRRICKLLWFGIQPVFVFDGGAPALKRATIQARHRRREGRRDDAVKTAGKLLAVQMQRIAQEEEERRKRDKDGDDISAREEAAQHEELPDMSTVVYADEFGMSQPERLQNRTFRKQDAYHLPELQGGIAGMGKPDDPRIMSVEELEEYARQFHNGEDINLYDFSKIDFDGDFFKSLPPPDRYNILNAARLRSRLRLGLSKEQLDEMFPDRMAFSKFQIERVKERNHLTQRLMYEVGMTGTDLTLSVNGRVAGEKDREYILVKNDGVEGGWALGVVSKEKDVGEEHKPIDVDAVQIQYQSKDAEDEDDDADFEDVPIEGVNRLPKPNSSMNAGLQAARDVASRRQTYFDTQRGDTLTKDPDNDGEDSLFVGGNNIDVNDVLDHGSDERLHAEEEDDLNLAIALSLQNQHGATANENDEEEGADELEDVPAPEWTQKPAEMARPITGAGGSMIAHIVNNRANAAVPKPREDKPDDDSDSDSDMQAVLARSRMKRAQQPKPAVENKKNPFDGPLPFPKLSWGSSLFSKKPAQEDNRQTTLQDNIPEGTGPEDDMAGGFEREDENAPKPLPPWLADGADIRDSLKQQQVAERNINAEDRAEAEEEQRFRKRQMRDAMIEIESSSDDSDVEIVAKPSLTLRNSPGNKPQEPTAGPIEVSEATPAAEKAEEMEKDAQGVDDAPSVQDGNSATVAQASEASPEPTFEDVEILEKTHENVLDKSPSRQPSGSPEPHFEDVPVDAVLVLEDDSTFPNAGPQPYTAAPATHDDDDELFGDVEYDEFSDPGDEELLTQMAEEAEEHARFASELNNKSAQQNREDYERELRQLRSQQKKDRRDADEVTSVMVTECQALLRLFGIPYITAPMEAEAQCAELVKMGLVDGIVTDDSDIFLFGGTRVYKNMFNGNKFVECYIAADLEKELSLSREQLISLAQLLGSDYTDGLSGVGPVTAVEILSEFPGKSGLQNFREWWLSVQSQERSKDADASSTFRKKFRKSQGTKLFLPTGFPNSAVYDAYLYPDVDADSEAFQWGVPDVEGLRQFLMATIGWSKERTDEVLVPVIKDMNKRDVEGTQSNITRFFGGSVGVGAKEAFAPRQRAQGSKRMAAAVDRLRSNAGADAGDKRKRMRPAPVSQGEDQDGGELGEDEADAPVAPASSGRGRGRAKRSKAA